MKSASSNHYFSLKGTIVIIAFMLSGFFGQCAMTVEILAMNHSDSVHSESQECEGICTINENANKEQIAILKDYPEPKFVSQSFSQNIEKKSFSGQYEDSHRTNYLSYLPTGTHLEGIKLHI